MTVSVRHPILGVIKRAFPPDRKIMALYDWVGSRYTHPEHFTLCFSPQSILYPEGDIALVASSLLCIEPQDFPIPLCRDDDELSVFSALSENSLDDTLIDHDLSTGTDNANEGVPKDSNKALEEVQSHPPAQLLEDDPEVSSSQEENIKKLVYLDVKRQKVKEQLGNATVTIKIINRHNCVKDMLALFKEQGIANCNLCFVFEGENASGQGVVGEVYSVFWDNFVYSYCEGASHFTFSVSAALSQDDFVATGRILTHQFIQTGTLPLQISEAIIQQAVVGQVPEECLIQLFLKLLHEKEKKKALLGVQPLPTEDVIEILCDYGITAVPNTSNIKKILLQLSETELIAKPFLCITKLREGMGSFWDGISGEEIHSMYSVCTPTHTNVLKNLQVMAEDQQEDKVSRWLIRYLKSKDDKLCRFL